MRRTEGLSGDTKDALARQIPAPAHCRHALLDGLVRFGARGALFQTRRLPVARLFHELSGRPIHKRPGTRLDRAPIYEIEAPHSSARRAARCDRRMELRAAFLARGSLSSPSQGYHLEWALKSQEQAEELIALLRSEGLAPKHGTRKRHPLVYFKDGDQIARVLSAIGAFGAVLHLEDVRALKETKNRIRRLVNTEAANVDRAMNAAAAQRELILSLADALGLQKLSPKLREVAELRLRYPTATLAELGEHCHPRATKSAVNGRLAALGRLAQRAREPAGGKLFH